MADVLEAMGFPSDWCEQALRSSGGVEPAVELLLQWQAEGGAPPGDSSSSPALPSSPPVSVVAVSTVTNPASSAAGFDAVVPDAGGAERSRRPNADLHLKKVLLTTHPLQNSTNFPCSLKFYCSSLQFLAIWI